MQMKKFSIAIHFGYWRRTAIYGQFFRGHWLAHNRWNWSFKTAKFRTTSEYLRSKRHSDHIYWHAGHRKRLSRYPQLYSRIGFAHEFDRLSKDETHHLLTYKWQELGLPIKLEDFSDYEALASIIKITNGNFRLIQRLFSQIERILEINQLTSITTEVVEAARDSLVIGIK